MSGSLDKPERSWRHVVRYVLQPTATIGDAWSWAQFVLPLLPTVIASATTAIFVSIDDSVWTLPAVLLATLLVLTLNAALRLAKELVAYETAPRPFLCFADTEVEGAGVHVFAHGAGATGAQGRLSTADGVPVVYLFARIGIKNNPPAGSKGLKAEKVAAFVTFERDGAPVVSDMVGRWSETDQRAETGRLGISLESAQLDIEPNGLRHPLDIAMKDPDDSSCYAYNEDNSSGVGLRLPSRELVGEEFTVHVQLRGSNTDEISASFLLKNGGAGSGISLERIEEQGVSGG
jgi:hypothetical protein